MSHTDAIEALIRAINYDDFDHILAAHHPEVIFQSFRGPILRNSLAVQEWQRDFLERYADCTYKDLEYLTEGDVVAVRATIEAKGYDWRRFEQNVLEVFELDEADLVAERRLYAQHRDIELDKPATQAMTRAVEAEPSGASDVRKAVEAFYTALLANDADAMREQLAEKCAYIDSVYGIVSGADAILDVLAHIPRPAFGSWRVTSCVAGEKSAVVEVAIDPQRARAADWVRVVEGKVAIIEAFWMMREIGLDPHEEYAKDRHSRRVIMPI